MHRIAGSCATLRPIRRHRHSRDPYKYVVILYFVFFCWVNGRMDAAHISSGLERGSSGKKRKRKRRTSGIVKENVSSTLSLSKVRTKSERRTISFFFFRLIFFCTIFAMPVLRVRIPTRTAHTFAYIPFEHEMQ